MTDKPSIAATALLRPPLPIPHVTTTSERALAREVRRLVLEVRTLAVSLRCAAADLERDPRVSDDERSLLLRRWIDQVRASLQEIEARRLRVVRVIARSTARGRELPEVNVALGAYAAAVRHARDVAGRLERPDREGARAAEGDL